YLAPHRRPQNLRRSAPQAASQMTTPRSTTLGSPDDFGDDASQKAPGALDGVRVVDLATLFAGPVISSIMADFGADVIKVEHPRGDALRTLGWHKGDVPLWWSLVGRNKRCVTLNLSHARGQDLLCRLIRSADVLIENFRPGTLERWNIGP